MSGFITIERSLWDHPIFARAPMTEREAWIWMIGQAAWAETQHFVGGKSVKIERGSFVLTLREMQSKLMWASDKRVRNYLKKLENCCMIAVQILAEGNAKKTHVTICNYDEYQSKGRSKDANGTQTGRKRDAVKNKVTKEQYNTEDKSSLLLPDGNDDDYQIFLSKHPKPRQSDAGRDAWLDAIDAGADAQEIVAAAGRYSEASKRFDDDKVKFSDNWLLAKGWEKYPSPKIAPTPSQDEILKFWADAINGPNFVAASSIKPDMARDLLRGGLVTEEKLKQRGIAA